jgi:hypothetical protein
MLSVLTYDLIMRAGRVAAKAIDNDSKNSTAF